ncbi:hypothetical protein COCSADRAFT_222361 [Bipolaris sorokiniana ND90Pr]|uniref:Uncharacterized protein n=1 Tax=Cochliobolus sativus (strain ND90Pr / ATCC 201652) TaxID=665912 RepID=M2T080_COCSN|nr:uncharacterized protein COCSADRAFT_222361 [Bipolaris sorokiniana ND90Pr]EMD62581.1 hypothetical protein COCSADRAFT_222361 [Bipolaris sorokiniana ND90Pr]
MHIILTYTCTYTHTHPHTHTHTHVCNNERTRSPRAPASAVIVDAAVSCAMQIPHSATRYHHTTSCPSQR